VEFTEREYAIAADNLEFEEFEIVAKWQSQKNLYAKTAALYETEKNWKIRLWLAFYETTRMQVLHGLFSMKRLYRVWQYYISRRHSFNLCDIK